MGKTPLNFLVIVVIGICIFLIDAIFWVWAETSGITIYQDAARAFVAVSVLLMGVAIGLVAAMNLRG